MSDVPLRNTAGRPGKLELARRCDENGVILVLRGELDLASAPQLEAALREIEATKPTRVTIDLRDLEFIDSTGVALVMRAQRFAAANGHILALRRGQVQVQRLFRLIGLLDRLPFED